MKKIIIIWALLISVCYAQSKAGFYVVGGKVITVQDTSSRNYLKAIENAGVVPSVLQNAASNFLVTSEKAIGSYSLMVAQYPFMGGTSATHIFNLNKPTGLAADFNLEFFGGVTHSANGIQGNGSTGYADTKLIPSTSLTLNNTHISVYINLSSSSETSEIGDNGGASRMQMHTRYSDGLTYFDLYGSNARIIQNAGNGLGYFLSNRTSSIYSTGSRNNIRLIDNVTSTASSLPNTSMRLLSWNGAFFSDKRLAYSSTGTGFTPTIEIQQSRIVTFFNSMQNR